MFTLELEASSHFLATIGGQKREMDTTIPEPLSPEAARPIIDHLLEQRVISVEGVEIWVRSRFRCEYCGADLLRNPQVYGMAESDHILPVSKYPALANDLNNYAHTCGLCNRLKRNWDPADGDPAFSSVGDRLTTEQRRSLIGRCREHLGPMIERKASEIATIRSILREHQQSV